jgi:hypothetical protein
MSAALPPPLPQPPSILNFTPLKWQKWYDAPIHHQEFLKWANGDTIRQLVLEQPSMAALLTQHLLEIQQAMGEQVQFQMGLQAPPPGPPAPPPPPGALPPHTSPAPAAAMQGGGRAMLNSNVESTKPHPPGPVTHGHA